MTHAANAPTVLSILAISGSLRAGSANGAIVDAAEQLAPVGTSVFVYDQLGELPMFNPDLEVTAPPAAVTVWRESLQTASAVLISSPEYAHGVPGVLKNALDWVVGTGEFMGKPIALITASAHSSYVVAQLTETLSVMMGDVVIATALTFAQRPSTAAEVLADEGARAGLVDALEILAAAARNVAMRETAEREAAAREAAERDALPNDEPRRLIPR